MNFATHKYLLGVSNKHATTSFKMVAWVIVEVTESASLPGCMENLRPKKQKSQTKSNKSTLTKIFCDKILKFN